jgi:hypothetical protein
MGTEQIEKHLKRRMWTEQGIVYFCRICGSYLPETQFYKSKTGPFRIDTKCKLHYSKKDPEDDGSMDYLKLDPLQDEHFWQAQRLLETLGYNFGPDVPPVHQQFIIKHKLNKNGKD